MVFALVIGVTAVTLQATVRKFWEPTLREQIERNLKQKALMFAQRVETDRRKFDGVAYVDGDSVGEEVIDVDAVLLRHLAEGVQGVVADLIAQPARTE